MASKWARNKARVYLAMLPTMNSREWSGARAELAQALDEARREGVRIGLEAAARQADHIYECANSQMKGLTGHPEDERCAQMLVFERGTAEDLGEKARTADPDTVLREHDEHGGEHE